MLPALTRLANFELRPLCNVLRVNSDSTGKKATGVTYIDAAGKEFLAARHADGAEFLARGCLMRAVVAEITDGPVPDCWHPESQVEENTDE